MGKILGSFVGRITCDRANYDEDPYRQRCICCHGRDHAYARYLATVDGHPFRPLHQIQEMIHFEPNEGTLLRITVERIEADEIDKGEKEAAQPPPFVIGCVEGDVGKHPRTCRGLQ
jgi:hypothetical protein